MLREWKRSGLSSHEFARVCGVSHASLYKWKRELGAADRKQSPAFVEVVAPISAHAEPELSRDGAESGVQLVYGATMRIHLQCGFDAATLRRAIEALAR